VLFGYVSISWYYSLYYFHWSNDQIKQYTDSQVQQTDLDEVKFEKVLAGLRNRDDVYHKPSEMVQNIFMTDRPKP
jgi:predicted acetyltransferase